MVQSTNTTRPRPPTPVIAMTAFEDIIPTASHIKFYRSPRQPPPSTTLLASFTTLLPTSTTFLSCVWETSRPALIVHVRHPTQRGFSIVLFPRISLRFIADPGSKKNKRFYRAARPKLRVPAADQLPGPSVDARSRLGPLVLPVEQRRTPFSSVRPVILNDVKQARRSFPPLSHDPRISWHGPPRRRGHHPNQTQMRRQKRRRSPRYPSQCWWLIRHYLSSFH